MDGPYSLLLQSTQRVVRVRYRRLIHVDHIVQIHARDIVPHHEDEVLGLLHHLLVVFLCNVSQHSVTQSN